PCMMKKVAHDRLVHTIAVRLVWETTNFIIENVLNLQEFRNANSQSRYGSGIILAADTGRIWSGVQPTVQSIRCPRNQHDNVPRGARERRTPIPHYACRPSSAYSRAGNSTGCGPGPSVP